MPCEVCGKTYIWNPDENVDAKPHVCKTCGLSFSLKIQLKRHAETHADGEPYICVTCSTNPSREESKSYNLRLKNEYACDVCDESFSSKRMLLSHSIKEHCLENTDDSEDSDYEEPKKKRRYNLLKRKPNIIRKRRITPPENKQFFCSGCGRGFVYQSFYDKHVRDGKCIGEKEAPKSSKGKRKSKKAENLESKKHECSICGKGFARKSSLEGHIVIHGHEDSDEGLDEKDVYDSNASESEDYVSEPNKTKSPKAQVIRKSYACDKCNFVCFSKPTFQKHSKAHENEDIITEVKDLAAPIPDSESNPDNANTEEKPPEKKQKETHLCEICDKVFVTKGRLKKHLLFHVTCELEEGEKDASLPQQVFNPGRQKRRRKNFTCEECGKRFVGVTCFNKHILKHQNEPPDFSDQAKQSKSSSRKKKWVPPMECEFCHEMFDGKRSAYIKHLHSHTPEVCGICDERFVDRASLREHCRIHIGTEEGRKFIECSQKALEAKLGIAPPEPKVEYIYLLVR